MENKEVAKVGSKDVVEFNEDLGFTGFEGVENDAESFALPFLKIAQALSKELDSDDENYIEGLEKGDFFNSVTGEIYGKEVDLIVVYSERVFNEYKPNRGGFVASHDRIKGSALIRDRGEYPFVNVENGNDLIETQVLFCITTDNAGAIVLPMSSTSLKHAKAFLSRASMLKKSDGTKAPLPSSVYTFGNIKKTNEHGTWYQIAKTTIERKRPITKEEAVAVRDAYKLFQTEEVDYAKAEDKQADLDFGNNETDGKPF